jgi:hypothetical protein
MKAPLAALALLSLAAGALADSSGPTFIVQNPHGGYNTIQGGPPPSAVPFFGPHGYASAVAAHAHDPIKFILVSKVIDDGHGKHTVYQRVYYSTPEEAQAAKGTVH